MTQYQELLSKAADEDKVEYSSEDTQSEAANNDTSDIISAVVLDESSESSIGIKNSKENVQVEMDSIDVLVPRHKQTKQVACCQRLSGDKKLQKEEPTHVLPTCHVKIKAKQKPIGDPPARKKVKRAPVLHKKLYYGDYLDADRLWFTHSKPKGLGILDLTGFTISEDGHHPTEIDVAKLDNKDFYPEQLNYNMALDIYKTVLAIPTVEEFEKLLKTLATQHL